MQKTHSKRLMPGNWLLRVDEPQFLQSVDYRCLTTPHPTGNFAYSYTTLKHLPYCFILLWSPTLVCIAVRGYRLSINPFRMQMLNNKHRRLILVVHYDGFHFRPCNGNIEKPSLFSEKIFFFSTHHIAEHRVIGYCRRKSHTAVIAIKQDDIVGLQTFRLVDRHKFDFPSRNCIEYRIPPFVARKPFYKIVVVKRIAS